MNGEKRPLLYLDFSLSGEHGRPPVDASRWEIHQAQSVEHARKLVAQQRYRVGLVCFNADFERLICDAIASFGQALPFMEWVGLIPRGSMVNGNSRTAHAIAEYFFDFHTLPADVSRLATTLGHAYGMSEIREQAAKEDDQGLGTEEEMVGTSPRMHELFRGIRKVASVDAPILIGGETGTGKELTARAIHERSRRHTGPFVSVDCGALPPTLIQSELFGYEKGAFTGANQRRIGQIECASGGTIFLDEIGDLPLDLQGNLLRFLQESTIRRVGGQEAIPVDVRIISATHVDLEKAIAEGRFRQDLYFRLNVLSLRVPALRERSDDIEILARYYFKKFSHESSNRAKGFAPQALRVMREHEWPGNVRELINRIRSAIVMCESNLITPADLSLTPRDGELAPPQNMQLSAMRAVTERQLLQQALTRCQGNLSNAARELGVSRVTIYKLLKKYDLLAGRRKNGARLTKGVSPQRRAADTPTPTELGATRPLFPASAGHTEGR